jgi:hypothetical protein
MSGRGLDKCWKSKGAVVNTIKFPRRAASGQTRLNVNINMQTAHDLKDISSREKLSITETVRRLVPMGAYIYRALLDGYNVQVVGPDGRVSKVVFDV